MGGGWQTGFNAALSVLGSALQQKGQGGFQAALQKQASANLPREKITTEAVSGEVSWTRSFGWLKADTPIEHAMASKRQGKIYVHKDGLQGLSELTVGQAVQFQVYVDSSGLGAEAVAAL